MLFMQTDTHITHSSESGKTRIKPLRFLAGQVMQDFKIAIAGLLIADIDPLTGSVTNEKLYSFQNDPSNDVLTHFQGIYYAGNGVYQVPFDAITSAGKLSVGIAYIKRHGDGTFSDNAIWQTFQAKPSDSQGLLLSNDSVAGSGSVGAFSNGSFTSFASVSETKPYLFAAQLLH
jgi:hypothetical protein